MLNPTEVHLLIGLLTQISRPDGVDIELGTMVSDAAAETQRDVDITIRTIDPKGGEWVFEGIEVKKHKRQLDVTHVEQLCAKLNDMPSLIRRGIVSASGYTEAAIRKARQKGVALYLFEKLDLPACFETVTIPQDLVIHESRYKWVEGPHSQFNVDEQTPLELVNQIGQETTLVDEDNRPLPNTPTLGQLERWLTSNIHVLAPSAVVDMLPGEIRAIAAPIALLGRVNTTKQEHSKMF